MKHNTPTLNVLNRVLNKLPELNQKSIKKITFTLLKNKILLKELIDVLTDVSNKVHECSKCRAYTENQDICQICSNSNRDKSYVCIVSDMINLIAIERAGIFNGVYYVLGGMICGLQDIGPLELELDHLMNFIKTNQIQQVLIGFSPTMEGRATSSLIEDMLKNLKINVQGLKIGIPLGGDLEYVDTNTLAHAIPKRII